MSSAIEETVKALVEFESELDRAKADVSEAKRKVVKDASDWAEAAKSTVISKADAMASERVAKARKEAEAEADKIKDRGRADLEKFEGSISRKKSKAAESVRARLLGESS